MSKYVEDMTEAEIRDEIEQAEQFMRKHGHDLHCGQQDRIHDRITELRAEAEVRKHRR